MRVREGLKFGTSGLRGLVVELVGWPAYAYTLAFLKTLLENGSVQAGQRLLIGRDLRTSSQDIAGACIAAAHAAGFVPVDAGALPTPALALASWSEQAPAIMVTGSHIPDDRNGLKFYTAAGEITKSDEIGILEQFSKLPETALCLPEFGNTEILPNGISNYVARYVSFFGPEALQDMVVGVYQHSSVARDILVEIIEQLGARAIALGRTDTFIPVDTEALRQEDIDLASSWAKEHRLDAIVSTDGDADRPLVADETGMFLRGDIIGLLTAKHLNLDTVVTPVTSNSAMEAAGFSKVERTKVGSPYVIAGMELCKAEGARGILGFEPNGGVLLGSNIESSGRTLLSLSTRDAALPILSVLAEARKRKVSVSDLTVQLAANHAAAHRLKDVPSADSTAFLAKLQNDSRFAEDFFSPLGTITSVSTLDGVRVMIGSGEAVHFRASGNAPELRCYVEAKTEDAAQSILSWGLNAAHKVISDGSVQRV